MVKVLIRSGNLRVTQYKWQRGKYKKNGYYF